MSPSYWFALLRDTIGLKKLRHFFIQSEVKPEPIKTHLYSFSRALRQLQEFTSSCDWFTVFSFVCDWPELLLWFYSTQLKKKTEKQSLVNTLLSFS